MPAPTTVDEFVDLVKKSAVLDEQRLTAYVQKLRSDPAAPKELSGIAGLFVRDGLLTYFQAEQFLQGRWKRFTIGKYKVLEKLGSGGMGQVFLCEHKLMRRRVAVKVLPTQKAADPSSLERFYREARAVAALDHQNIVRAYDIDQDDNLHFLVMEYVDGASLQDMIRKTGKMDYTRACHYMYWSAIGLQHAHAAGLIHRDIKPGNILVDRLGVVKILDLGLARFFNDDQDLLTKKYDESVLGTADYLAPEQAIDSHQVDGRADIYSLGATFYFLLTGNPPFAEGSVAQKLLWHQTRTPKPIRDLRPDVPANIAAVLEKMMAKKPEDRYANPEELAQALLPFTQTPIPPPPDEEMPQLSAAALGTSSSVVPVSSSPRTMVTTPRTPAPAHESKAPQPPSNPSSKPAPVGSSQAIAVADADTQRNKPVPVVEPIPDSSPGAQIWESLGADTANAAHADTDRRRRDGGSSKRDKGKAEQRPEEKPKSVKAVKPSAKKSKPPLVLVLVLVAGAILVGAGAFATYWFGFRDRTAKTSNGPVEPRTLVLTRNPAGAAYHYSSLQKAVEEFRTGDTIVIRDEVWEEFGAVTRARGLVLSAPEGKRVVWRAPANKKGNALLSLANTEGAKISGIVFECGGQVEHAVRVSGQSPGLVLEDVEMLDASVSAVAVHNCVGEPNRPVVIRKCRFGNPGGKDSRAAVVFTADPVSKTSVPTGSQHVQILQCVGEGPYSSAAFQFEGSATGVEIRHCRVGRSENGVVFKKSTTSPDAVWQVQIVGNTIQTTPGAGIVCEDPAAIAKRPQNKIVVERNFFVGEPARVGADPAAPFMTADGNYRKAGTPVGSPNLPTTEIAVELPTDPAKFLTYDKNSPLYRAFKNAPVGAPPD